MPDALCQIHGWPDLWIGWRNQVPALLDMGFRVICPDLMGFGGTDAPEVPPQENLVFYSFKRIAQDVKALATQLGADKIILGGHDWVSRHSSSHEIKGLLLSHLPEATMQGGAVVYRIALWYPGLVSHVFAICTPYIPPNKEQVDLEQLVRTRLPNFAYQLQFAGGEVEKHVRSREEIRQFLNAAYGSRTPSGEPGFDVRRGVIFENLADLKPTKMMTAALLNYYTDQYAQNGVHGSRECFTYPRWETPVDSRTVNWYRTRDQNFQDELQ